ncbi:tryptophan synthase subunit beta [Pararhodobacter sp.]|uniref:tryptophan synthase subunit beta n=1 Tax=Pararhodobacter sp. TaxID=2127056 RepID=UPI002AFE3EFB|nr:tryptophan synthase subunit beta [Pararhodobacter sp.]
MTRRNRRYERQLARLGHRVPVLGGTLRALTLPGRRWLRLPVALLLIICGVLGFLPILGFWMLPLGALLLATDLRILRAPLGALIVRLRAMVRRWNLRF